MHINNQSFLSALRSAEVEPVSQKLKAKVSLLPWKRKD